MNEERAERSWYCLLLYPVGKNEFQARSPDFPEVSCDPGEGIDTMLSGMAMLNIVLAVYAGENRLPKPVPLKDAQEMIEAEMAKLKNLPKTNKKPFIIMVPTP